MNSLLNLESFLAHAQKLEPWHDETGIGIDRLSSIRQGSVVPRSSEVAAIAKALGQPVTAIWDRLESRVGERFNSERLNLSLPPQGRKKKKVGQN